jgi:2-oxoglutarate dehydrogenase E1 component
MQLSQIPGSVDMASTTSQPINTKVIEESLKVMLLVRSYQIRGHALANLDPLGLTTPTLYPELTLNNYGWTEADLDREVILPLHPDITSGFIASQSSKTTLREILNKLKTIYCGTIGIEYMHIQSREQRNWLRERFESEKRFTMSKVGSNTFKTNYNTPTHPHTHTPTHRLNTD